MSRRSQDADLVIAGAGCAGLSALWHALHDRRASSRRILVVDQRLEPGDDRSWSFWGPSTTPFAGLADGSWDRVGVRFPEWSRTDPLRGGRRYWRVRQRDYDRRVLELAASRPNVELVSGRIAELRDEADGAVVVLADGTSAGGEVRAPVVFQSVRLAPGDRSAHVRHPLRQHFGGWEVRTEFPVFDPAVVTLMDFDTEQYGGVAFHYVLPEAPDRALVEHTMFSASVRTAAFHDRRVREHLERAGAGEVEIARVEHGTIPMEDRVLEQRWGRHIWNLGTVGGMTKPSTGYTFQRIHTQTRHLVRGWSNGTITPAPPGPRRYAAADRMLLHILHHEPERGRQIFERLFRSTSVHDVLTFLDEESRLGRDLRMISHLPWSPFLRAAVSEFAAGVSAGPGRIARGGRRVAPSMS